MRAVVVGAGCAGLAVARALRTRGIDFEVLEARAGLGGMWRLDDDGCSPAYRSLRANVSRQRSAYPGFAMARRRDPFPTREEMHDYLERFADHHDLRRSVTLGTPVRRVTRAGGGWRVEVGDGPALEADAVVVAVGFNTVPHRPDVPGEFGGLQLHSAEYADPAPFAGRDVVVVGLGCSAVEIGPEVASVARSVTIASRSGAWITPRRLGPVPLDWFDGPSNARVPWELRRVLFTRLIRAAAGRPEAVGLPAPGHVLGAKPISLSDTLHDALRAGRVRIAPGVRELRGDGVVLQDGTELQADALIWATGYETTFPFLDVDPRPTTHRGGLYRGVADPLHRGLFYAGLALAHGALIPVFDAQARWIAAVLGGDLHLPDADQMQSSIEADQRARHALLRAEHDLLWGRWPYVRALQREARAAGRHPGTSRRATAATI